MHFKLEGLGDMQQTSARVAQPHVMYSAVAEISSEQWGTRYASASL